MRFGDLRTEPPTPGTFLVKQVHTAQHQPLTVLALLCRGEREPVTHLPVRSGAPPPARAPGAPPAADPPHSRLPRRPRARPPFTGPLRRPPAGGSAGADR